MFKKQQGNKRKKTPFHGDDRMEHVFTVDLRGARHVDLPKEVAALALFITSRSYNEAWRPDNRYIAVVLLGEQHLALGPYKGKLPGGVEGAGRTFDLVTLNIPSVTFDDGHSSELRDVLFNVDAYFGGHPIWIQGAEDEYVDDYDDGDYDDEDDDDGAPQGPSDAIYTLQQRGQGEPAPAPIRGSGDFVGQCNERFGDVNLGDSGELYIFGSHAFSQGY